MTRFAGEAIQGTAAEEALRASQGLGDQASLHIDLNRNKRVGINDGKEDVILYKNNESLTYPGPAESANPVEGGPGAIGQDQMDRETLQQLNDQFDYDRDSHRFGGRDMAGVMGMERGNTARIVHDLGRGRTMYQNDGDDGTYVVRRGRGIEINRSPANAYPVTGEPVGASVHEPMDSFLHQRLSPRFNEAERNGRTFGWRAPE
jgi:hypothetical protein